MRSRAEWALRAIALFALVALAWQAFSPRELPRSAAAGSRDLDRALVSATRQPLAQLTLDLDRAPDEVQRDWLAAVRGAGTKVTWRGDGLTPIAASATPVVAPGRRVRVAVAGPDGATVALADALGPIDSVRVQGVESSVVLRTASGDVVASAPGARAVAELPPPVSVRRVLVLGSAGWESKFVVAALEEAGWQVDARLRVAPGVEVRQGRATMPDTAVHSAVVALDASAAQSGQAIARFVRAGGGAVLAGSAVGAPSFTQITPASAAVSRSTQAQGANLTARADAVVLQRTDAGTPTVVARRAGFGRVVASAYSDTWRWRMSPAADSLIHHREWWTALVAAVAAAPVPGATGADGGADPAPVAALASALGPPADHRASRALGSGARMPPAWLFFGLFLASLLAEVVSRRRRGLA